jgi:starch-binding outer membrane protein, SusD/RagB family
MTMASRPSWRVALALTLLVAAPACTDLGVQPKSTVTTANIYTDPGSYRSYLAKLYAGLQATGQTGCCDDKDIQTISDAGFSGYLRLYWNLQEVPTEAAAFAWNDDPLIELTTLNWGPGNNFIAGMYARIYFQVGHANEFLRQSTEAALASRGQTDAALRSEVATYRAEARFLRALSYYHALDLFGNVPVVDETFQLGSAPPAQNTRAEVFEFVESELLAIRDQLPPANSPNFYGRATQGAADMLLAHLYLNAQVYTGAERYSDARLAAERVIAYGYTLAPEWQHNFLADNHTSPEMIFPIPSDGERQQSYGGMTTILHAQVGPGMSASEFGINGGWYGFRVRPQYADLFGDPDTTSDARGQILFDEDNEHTRSITQLRDRADLGYGIGKYKNVTKTGTAGKHAEFVDTDFPYFRLADAYLIYAEAHLRGGGGTLAQALQYVNALRERAYGDASGNIVAAELTLPFILEERARELALEAKRRTDLVRFGQFAQGRVWEWKGNIQAGTNMPPHFDLYPIPAGQLIANPNLDQNPGYGN